MSESVESVNGADYGVMIKQSREPVVQKDGCKYSDFVFQTSECGTTWRISWKRTHSDGRWTHGKIVMAGNPTNVVHVNQGDLS